MANLRRVQTSQNDGAKMDIQHSGRVFIVDGI